MTAIRDANMKPIPEHGFCRFAYSVARRSALSAEHSVIPGSPEWCPALGTSRIATCHAALHASYGIRRVMRLTTSQAAPFGCTIDSCYRESGNAHHRCEKGASCVKRDLIPGRAARAGRDEELPHKLEAQLVREAVLVDVKWHARCVRPPAVRIKARAGRRPSRHLASLGIRAAMIDSNAHMRCISAFLM